MLPEDMTPSEFPKNVFLKNDAAVICWRNYDDMLSRFDIIPERDRRMDG